MAARRRGALRHSLLARMLASSVLVAVCSITATAWLAVQGTSESLTVQQGETLAVDTRIHDTLVAYAAAHPEWDGVRGTVRELAGETGRRIVLTTENHGLIADSTDEARPLPSRTSSVVDPLAVDVTLAPDVSGRIDPRAVGPFALSDDDGARLLDTATAGAECLVERYGLAVEVETGPSGRPAVTGSRVDAHMWADCSLETLDEPTEGERRALEELNRLVRSCLGAEEAKEEVRAEFRIDGAAGVPVAMPPLPPPADEARAPLEPSVPGNPSEEPTEGGAHPSTVPEDEAGGMVPDDGNGEPQPWLPPQESAGPEAQEEPAPAPEPTPEYPVPDPASDAVGPREEVPAPPEPPRFDARTSSCLDSARREQLDPYVAPAALLFIDDPEREAAGVMPLTGESLLRVFGVVLLVLVLTVVVSVVLSTRLVRPVRALTDAVRRMREGRAGSRVRVRDSGEIGQLADAFNEMAEHLERLEEQRKAMVSDVSHELRTPLSNLRGWLEAAQDGIADLDRDRMGMLVGETLLLQDIVDDLQDLALADAGKLRLSPEPVDAGLLVEQVVDSQRLRAGSAGLRLVAETEDVVLVADRTRLVQAIGNLLGNALRHTPAPGTVTVGARRSGGEAVIDVADTGVGIPARDLPYVFDRFWRAEKSRNRRTGGSGLGLAIVRNLVELHGGSVTVDSVLGEGTTFTVRLPLADPGETPED
ncbi:two-component system sensor histidine kinase BaeS [Nocardiopsis arvandica]|uniref:histidine kinase n=1 Tax=Nocardiopsis sinuspersici TaxID=501010 RepID=A0A7Y9XC58_9ACTN|nr:HAMP domain-containing sensor histidine kinase [Nocardiopsis sinuspersici]NYH52889.1 two-component system sensor histidine kinase BaeS [Nocardiopsis sinuspersici]